MKAAWSRHMARGRNGVAPDDQAELTMLKGRKAMPSIWPTGLVRWLSQEGCCYAKPYPEEFCKPRRRKARLAPEPDRA